MKSGTFKLIINMLVKFSAGFLIIGILLFGCAGSVSYPGGWLFIIALAIPMSIFGAVLLVKDPAVLERRMASREPDKKQGANIAAMGILFPVSFIVAGLDYRFGWSKMIFGISIAALIAMLFGYGMYVAVIMKNAYASRVVDIYEDQKIITDGIYSLVRHPMYLAFLIILFSIPLTLGSWFAIIPMIPVPLILARRIKNEEEMLVRELAGYSEYIKKVKYKLLPFVF